MIEGKRALPGETLLFAPGSYVERLQLDRLFEQKQPVEVELGAGDGSFLAAYAKARPELNFIGVERLLGRLSKIDRKARRAGLKNLRLVRLEASYFVQYLLPKESIHAFHIYFPDPWPKRRHWKHRLINEEFVPRLRDALRPGGIVYLRTDNRSYFEQMVRCFYEVPGFSKLTTPQELLEFKTDFERGFNNQGIPTLEASYQRIEAA